MRGKVNIINSPQDMDESDLTREQVIEMATITVRYDDAQYPDDYDTSLTDKDDGYIEPVWRFEKEIDQGVLDKFGLSNKTVLSNSI